MLWHWLQRVTSKPYFFELCVTHYKFINAKLPISYNNKDIIN
ncbi:hypothetical protein N499_0814 [Wolbachia pipientis wVitA]|nr:hypothetical protein N499_0814 [Wolbachia pipientis wVitA]